MKRNNVIFMVLIGILFVVTTSLFFAFDFDMEFAILLGMIAVIIGFFTLKLFRLIR